MLCIEVSKDCKNPDSYGEICVRCNECGRFDIVRKCINCGKELKGVTLVFPAEWKQVEFWDSLREPVCPDCIKYFPDEIITDDYSNKVISCKVADFKKRPTKDGKEQTKTTD